MTDIKTPACPACDSPPLFAGVLPYFCSNTECRVMSWDPTMSLDEILKQEPKIIDENWLSE